MISAGVARHGPDRYDLDLRRRPAVRLAEGPDVFWEVAAPELGDRDCLSLTVSLGEAVALLEFLGPSGLGPGGESPEPVSRRATRR